jgi:hypothetical protein
VLIEAIQRLHRLIVMLCATDFATVANKMNRRRSWSNAPFPGRVVVNNVIETHGMRFTERREHEVTMSLRIGPVS